MRSSGQTTASRRTVGRTPIRLAGRLSSRVVHEEIQLLRGIARIPSLALESLHLLERGRPAQQRLGAGEGQTRQAPGTADYAFVAIDGAGLITAWTRQAQATFGWSSQEALGRELAEMVLPERYREAHRRSMAHFQASGERVLLGKRLELSALDRGGHELPVEVIISAREREHGYTFDAFVRDISERQRHERYLRAQHNTAVVLAEAERVSDALPRLLEAIGEPMGCDFGAVWKFADGRLYCDMTWMVSGSEVGRFEDVSKKTSFETGVGLPGVVFQRARPAVVRDVRQHQGLPRARAARETGLSLGIAVPVCVGGEVRAVIEFFGRGLRYPKPELLKEMGTLTALIGRFCSIVTEREEARGQLERLARTDELTGLLNRRAWVQALENELARSRRSGEDVCVAFVDLDHFKRYNDEHGHPAGDDLLQTAAVAWTACLRATDVMARIGGDEFALALPAKGLAGALAVIERLRTATPRPITCSAGLALWQPGETAHEVAARADTALYEAKTRGGGVVVVAERAATRPATRQRHQ